MISVALLAIIAHFFGYGKGFMREAILSSKEYPRASFSPFCTTLRNMVGVGPIRVAVFGVLS